MFERYTDRARRVIVLAQSEARDLGHAEICPDHLLLGLAAEGEATAFQALDRCGVTASGIRTVIAAYRPKASPPPGGHQPFTRELKRALEYALRESLRLDCNYVGAEHLLLGLLRHCEEHPDSLSLAALKARGTSPGAVRDAVMTLLHGYAQAEGTAGAAPESKPDDPMTVLLARVDGIARTVESLRRHLGVPE